MVELFGTGEFEVRSMTVHFLGEKEFEVLKVGNGDGGGEGKISLLS